MPSANFLRLYNLSVSQSGVNVSPQRKRTAVHNGSTGRKVGATPAVVQRQLRHSDGRITLGIYGRVVADEQRTVVQNRSARLVHYVQLLESGVLLESLLASR